MGSRDRSNIDSWLRPPCARIVGRVPEKVGSAAVIISGREGIDCFSLIPALRVGVSIRDNRRVTRFPLAGEQAKLQIGKYATLDI
jgi:hypothetical protein